jgi:hypothetical protein
MTHRGHSTAKTRAGSQRTSVRPAVGRKKTELTVVTARDGWPSEVLSELAPVGPSPDF